jgi:hypothetical protein
VASSFDDHYALSAGMDGVLLVHRIRSDFVDKFASSLSREMEAGLFQINTKQTKSLEPAYLTRTFGDKRDDWSLFGHEASRKKKGIVDDC